MIDWHYVDIWTVSGMSYHRARRWMLCSWWVKSQFIRHFNIPYCALYDLGYTSLGGTKDTLPNPALQLSGSTPIDPKFRPAYELIEDAEERLGRDRK